MMHSEGARGETARRILDIAERHLMRGGYHAFSYQDIAAELGVKPPAIHYHFRTKAALVAEVLDRYRGRFRRWSRAQAEAPAREQLVAYIALSRELLCDQRIDPFGTMAGEHDQLPEEVQARLVALQAEIFGWFGGLLAAGREAGELSFAGDPASKAAEVACAMLGAQQLGRVCGAAAFEQVAAQVQRSLGAA